MGARLPPDPSGAPRTSLALLPRSTLRACCLSHLLSKHKIERVLAGGNDTPSERGMSTLAWMSKRTLVGGSSNRSICQCYRLLFQWGCGKRHPEVDADDSVSGHGG